MERVAACRFRGAVSSRPGTGESVFPVSGEAAHHGQISLNGALIPDPSVFDLFRA